MTKKLGGIALLHSFFGWASQYRGVLLFCFIAGVADIGSRFSAGDAKAFVVADHPHYTLKPSSILTAPAYDAYLQRLETYRRGPDAQLDINLEAEGSSSSSAERSWGYGGFEYRLIGVFNGLEEFALIGSLDVANNGAGVIRLRSGDDFDGHRVVAIVQQGLVLDMANGERMNIHLFDSVGKEVE